MTSLLSSPKLDRSAARRGFSLIELLVVLAIIAILCALVFAAIQQARETAKRVQCAANLRQLALASLDHHSMRGHFPSGGWGWSWIGDPDAGYDQNQPGGWCFNILPYIEQGKLHDLGATPGVPWTTSWNTAAKKTANGTRASQPVQGFNCPTRRGTVQFPGGSYINATGIGKACRTDYAANVGSQNQDEYFQGPGDVPTGLNPLYWSVSGLGPAPASAGHDTSGMTGVIFERSMIRMVDVTRGPGQVYLLGEKYLNPQNYFTGADGGDNECMEVGQDNDICRDTSSPPLHDQSGNGDTQRFGSAHINGCNMAFCDGSVQFISYKISPAVHLAAGSRY